MAEITCTRRIQFCAGHRVHKHESRCNSMHGHNYVALFEARCIGGGLDSLGRVIDFSVLKERLGGWIDRNWDHGFIHHDADTEVAAAVAAVGGTKGYALPYNPTAENMARYLLNTVAPEALAGTGVEVTEVLLWETENCYARVRLG